MSEEVKSLRLEYRACLKLANETDSKKEDTILREEAKRLLVLLREKCPHAEVVMLRSAYEGSSCMDYDDRHGEDRICLCCGYTEYASYSDMFTVLKVMPIARFENNAPPEVAKPLEYLLTDSVETALEKGYRVFLRPRNWR